MGGNLFKVGRVDKERYSEIVTSLVPVLDRHFGDRYGIPKPYRDKADYGDVDIILDAGAVLNQPDWFGELCSELGVEETHSVRNVKSMLYHNFQVDIFMTKTTELESSVNFMSYNILGNLIGRIYHKFNLRYGEAGLFYVLRGFNNHISKEVIVSRDMKEILTFIGLSYERWKQGFNNLEEIFDYVISSKYFCSNSYDPEYFNVRKRANERPDFVKFLEYLENNKIEINYPFVKTKEIYLDEIDAFFQTNLKEVYEKHLIKQERLLKISEKFNGRIIMNLLKVEGKELGAFISNYKNEFQTEEAFEIFILNASQKEIEQDILLKSVFIDSKN
jgi:hypothetical protein